MDFPMNIRRLYFPPQQLAEAATTIINQNEQPADSTSSTAIRFSLVVVLVLYMLLRAVQLAEYLRGRRLANANGDIETGIVKQPDDMEEFLDALPLTICGKQTKEMYDIECVVCLERFKEGDRCRVLRPCKHTYHMLCIDEWLYTSISCPLCRNIIRVDL